MPTAPDLQGHDHIGVTPQLDGEHSAVGLIVPVGRLRADQLFEIVRLSREYGRGEVRLTHQQNVLIPWVVNERVDELLGEPLLEDLPANPPLFTRGLQTCTGKEFCGLAKVFTKDRAAEIAKFLDQHVRVNGHGDDFRLHFAGCSSSCAQQQIADVGIEGVLKKFDGEFVEAMDIRIGGRLGPSRGSATSWSRRSRTGTSTRRCCGSSPSTSSTTPTGETFRAFAGRTEPEWWTERLEPAEVPS